MSSNTTPIPRVAGDKILKKKEHQIRCIQKSKDILLLQLNNKDKQIDTIKQEIQSLRSEIRNSRYTQKSLVAKNNELRNNIMKVNAQLRSKDYDMFHFKKNLRFLNDGCKYNLTVE